MDKALEVINSPSQHTTQQDEGNIDLTLATRQLKGQIRNWQISEDSSCSDHNLINFDLIQLYTTVLGDCARLPFKGYNMDQDRKELCNTNLELQHGRIPRQLTRN